MRGASTPPLPSAPLTKRSEAQAHGSPPRRGAAHAPGKTPAERAVGACPGVWAWRGGVAGGVAERLPGAAAGGGGAVGAAVATGARGGDRDRGRGRDGHRDRDTGTQGRERAWDGTRDRDWDRGLGLGPGPGPGTGDRDAVRNRCRVLPSCSGAWRWGAICASARCPLLHPSDLPLPGLPVSRARPARYRAGREAAGPCCWGAARELLGQVPCTAATCKQPLWGLR